jgi:hypothetical protein
MTSWCGNVNFKLKWRFTGNMRIPSASNEVQPVELGLMKRLGLTSANKTLRFLLGSRTCIDAHSGSLCIEPS